MDYGLLGYPLSHSFSKAYFEEKFRSLQLEHAYTLFEAPHASAVLELFSHNPRLRGVNVTIPHKVEIIRFLDDLDESAFLVGAVNVIKREPDGKLKGYNTDFMGFELSLIPHLQHKTLSALVLGNGGAARAVRAVLNQHQIASQTVSRQANAGLLYEDLSPEIIQKYHLVINTTPLGTWPNVETAPLLPYEGFSSVHLAYDLVYNPAQTLFMKKAAEFGAKTQNGLAMLHAQAEFAWKIWQS